MNTALYVGLDVHIDSLHWRLWYGQTDRARDALAQTECRLHAFDAGRARSGRTAGPARRLRTAIGNLGVSVCNSRLLFRRRASASHPEGPNCLFGWQRPIAEVPRPSATFKNSYHCAPSAVHRLAQMANFRIQAAID